MTHIKSYLNGGYIYDELRKTVKLLSSEIATELRGRTISFSVFPLSFREYLAAKNINFTPRNILYSKERIVIKKHFNEYVKNGGFPATLVSSKPQELLKEYYRVMFYRDIVERHDVANTKLLEDFLALLIDQTACKFSISKTAVKLQELGFSFSKNTLSNFLSYAEEAYLLFPVKKYSFKIREQMRAPQKLYAIDHGLVEAIRFHFMENYGRIIENIVYMELKRRSENIYYYHGKHECDFITTENGKITNAIQVTKTIENTETKRREIDGLLDIMQHAKLRNDLILTENEHESLEENGYKIDVLPIWHWILI